MSLVASVLSIFASVCFVVYSMNNDPFAFHATMYFIAAAIFAQLQNNSPENGQKEPDEQV